MTWVSALAGIPPPWAIAVRTTLIPGSCLLPPAVRGAVICGLIIDFARMKNMNRKIALISAALVLAVACYFFWDSAPPSIVLETPSEVGAGSTIVLSVEDQGRGLGSLQVALRQGEYSRNLLEEHYPTIYWPWERNQGRLLIELEPEEWLDRESLKEGPFELDVSASDAGDYGLFSDTVQLSLAMALDMTPPGIEVLSSQHNVRRGGAETVRYRIKGDSAGSGVMVGENRFEGFPAENGDGSEFVVIFVWAYDQPVEERVRLWAEDAVGNRMEILLPCQKIERKFRQRTLNVSDSFIDKVAPEILRLSPDVQEQEDSLRTYLAINRDLRILNNRKIAEVSTPVSGGIQWKEPFLQMRNSRVEALFADYRSYHYNGEKVDEQVHLGYDLASTANSPIEASNDGAVAFADNLGIYGNCIIIDHGLGLYSLYGHLSSLDVKAGKAVSRGEIIGRSGQTGLAGGDHLHYSMLVQGVQTNPLEWWDPSWVRLHVLDRVNPAGD